MPRPFHGLLAALLASLVLPSSALAAETLTVDPADSNGCTRSTDNTCKTISQALGQAQAGDTISILKGTYAESVTVPSSLSGLKIAGTGDVKITGSGTGDVLTIQAPDVQVAALAIEVPSNAGSAVRIDTDGRAALSGLIASRTQSSTVNDPVIDVAGTASIASSLILQQAGAVGTPAIASSGADGTQLADVIAASFTGPAAVFSKSDKNTIQRSQLLSGEATSDRSDAVQLLSADAGARKLVVDSSILAGGPKAAGVLVKSTGTAAGNEALELRHATVVGGAKGLDLDASQATGTTNFPLPIPGTAAGSINARVASSIVHPASTAKGFKADALGTNGTSNAVALSFADSDSPPAEAQSDNATVDMGNSTNTPDSQLFAKGYRLRQDAPVIDKGGAVEPGESAKDVNGDARQVGGATDKGADEFVNLAPKAVLDVAPASVRQDQLVGYAATQSTDPEQVNNAGGGITEYQWDFGDGAKQTTTSPTTLHSYPNIGTYTVTLVVKDKGGLSSAPVTKTVTVTDGKPPVATFLTPADGAKLKLNPKKHGKRRKLQLTLLGKATDASGVAKVELTIYATKRTEKGKKLGKGQCLFYTGRTFSKKACTKEVWLTVTPSGEGWRLKTKKGVRIPPGRYAARVRATDKTGLLSTTFTVKDRSLVRFTVK
jgi:hypothetical protein